MTDRAYDPLDFLEERAAFRVQDGNDANPDDASRAHELSSATGVPPEYVNSDVDEFDKNHRAQLGAEIVRSDRKLQGYVNSNPLAAEISNDDWGNLGRISRRLRLLGGPGAIASMFVKGEDRDWLEKHAFIGGSVLGATARGFKEGLEEAGPLGSWMVVDPETRKKYPQYAALMDKIANSNIIAWSEWALLGLPLDVMRWGVSGTAKAALEGSKELYLGLGGSPEGAAAFSRDIAAMVEAEITGRTGHHTTAGPTTAAVRQIAFKQATDAARAEFQEAARLAKPYLDAGEKPPKGLHPILDQAHALETLIDFENHEKVAEELQKSATLARNPEFFIENFLSQYPESMIELDGKKIAELYGTKEPSLDDNLLGWAPNISDQLRNARETGADVVIPRNEWLARSDKDLRKELADFTTFRPGGFTQPEAKEALKPVDLGPRVVESRDPAVDAARSVGGFREIPEESERQELWGTHYLLAPKDDFRANEISIIDKVNEELAKIFPTGKGPRTAAARELGIIDQPEFDIHGLFTIYNNREFPPILLWSLGAKDPVSTVRHEAIHAMRRMGFLSPEEWGILERASEKGNWIEKHNIKQDYPTRPPTVQVEESIAKEFQQWSDHYRPGHVAEGVFGKILEVLKAVRRGLKRALGFEPTFDDLFRQISEGEIGRREPTEPMGIDPAILAEQEKKEPPLFTPSALGMSKSYYRTLLELAQKRLGEDLQYIQDKTEKLEGQRLTKEWEENEKEVRAEVKDKLLHRPDLAADSFLRSGSLFGRRYRRERLDQKFLTPDQKALLDQEHYGSRGLHPDHLAQILGIGSGDEMIEALGRLEKLRDAEGLTPKAHFDKILDAETERIMQQRFQNPEQTLANAKEHVLSTTQDQLLDQEVIRIATQLGQEITIDKPAIQSMARLSLSLMTIPQINSTRILEKVGKIGRQVEKSMAEGKWQDAFESAQHRQIEFWKARYAMDAEKMQAKFDRYSKRAKPREPKNLPTDYSNAIQDVLLRAGETINRTSEDIAREYAAHGHEGLKAFTDNVNHGKHLTIDGERHSLLPQDPNMALESETLTIAPFLFNPNWTKAVKDMKLDEFTALFNSVDSLFENARQEGKFIREGKEYDLNDLVDELVGPLKEVKGGDVHTYPLGEIKTPLHRAYWSSLIQMESIFNRIARGDPDNPWLKLVDLPTMKSGNEVRLLEREYSREYAAIPKFPKNMNKLIPNHLFFDPLQKGGEIPDYPATLTTRQLLAILQNVGNYSNFDKLTRGYGIPAQVAKQWQQGGYQMGMNDPLMTWLFQHTTKADWDRAQAIGDLFQKLFEHSERIYYDMGARPGARIELRPIETPFGTYPGWYHPVVYDPARPNAFISGPNGEITIGGNSRLARSPFEDGGFYKAIGTSAGYQKARTGYAAPILLSFDPIPFKMKQIINDIAMRQTVTELNKLFEHPKLRAAMTTYYGKEYTDLLRPYLRDIAGQRQFSDNLGRTAQYWAEFFYQNAVTTLIGFNPGTVLKHFTTAMMTSMAQAPPGAFAKELLVNLLQAPFGHQNWNFALENSGLLQSRGRNWYETFTGAQQDLFRAGTTWDNTLEGFRQALIKAGSTPVAWSDMVSAVAVWNAVYKAERANRSHGEAVALADFAVRKAHGDTSVTARPYITRQDSAMARAVVPFYTFFNEMLQRQYETAWRAKDAKNYLQRGEYQKGLAMLPKIMMGLWTYWIFQSAVEHVVSPIEFTEDDNYLTKGAKILAHGTAASWPIARDFVGFALDGHDPSVSLYANSYKAVESVIRDIEKGELSLDEDHRGKTIKHAATALGVLTGLTNQQEGRWAQFAYDYSTGRQEPEGLPDWYRALRFGDITPPKEP